MAFVDEVEILIGSGKGGPGCVSFRRESHVPRGGPDGGDGGRGGHIIIKVNDRFNTLIQFQHKRKFFAPNGEAGKGDNCTGKDGEDIILNVPPGTVVKTLDGEVLYDLKDDEEFILLEGGIGGKGNPFYKNSINQAPEVAQKGMPGQTLKLKLELKLIADIGLVGFPNVGKSTLISHISAAKPKVANYPFTTLEPNLGVVKISETQSFVVADIPGIIEGASEGIGLGLQFLRHIERTAAFLHLIDLSEETGRDPIEDFDAINNELKKYDDIKKEEGATPLFDRPQIVVLNKIDVATPSRLFQVEQEFKKRNIEVFKISAVTGQNVQDLKFKLFELVEKHRGKNE